MKKYIIFLSLFMICIVAIVGLSFVNIVKINEKRHLSKKEKMKELVNISELSNKFMEDYFADYASMASRGNLDNVLIVISDKGIDNSYGATDVVNAPNHQYFLQYKTEEQRKKAYKRLKKDGYVSVEENQAMEITEEDEGGNSNYLSWGIQAMGLDYAINDANSRNLPNVTVAVIDTGLDVNNFKSYFSNSKLAGTYNVVNSTSDVTDVDDHGTHVSGTVAEGTPDNVSILAIKAGEGVFSYTSIISAINYAISQNVDVINMSFGGYVATSLYQTIESAKQQNIISVCGSGNDGTSQNFYPAAYDNTISVSAVDSELNKTWFSNYGITINFTAPGDNIDGISGVKTGTSMATPHVAAAVAIVKSYNKNLNLAQTIDVLSTTADDLGDYGWDPYNGEGFINFRNRKFCEEGVTCDAYNIFENDEIALDDIVGISFDEIYTPKYNYGNITNLMDSRINIYYDDNDYVTKYLGEIDDVEIENYDPNSNTVQNVSIKYKGKSAILTVDNTNNTISGWNYTIADNNITITEFLNSGAGPIKVYVPSKIDDYNVTTLGEGLFENNTFVKKVYLPESVINIGDNVFKNANMEVIDIKASNINVGDYAFYGLKELKKISSTINSLGNYSFANCYSLNNIILADHITRISDYAFTDDHNLDSINIPSNITYIGDYALSGTKISSLEIPNGVEEINEGVCYNCYNLKNLVISNGVKRIGEKSFQANNLETLFIPESIEKVTTSSFIDISTLDKISVDANNKHYRSENNMLIDKLNDKLIIGTSTSIDGFEVANIPSSVKIIGENAFYKKARLDQVNIPDGVEKIEDYAFYYDLKLQKIIIPKSVVEMGKDSYVKLRQDLVNWVYYDSYAMNFIEGLGNRNYKTIDPYYQHVNISKTDYSDHDTVDTNGLSIDLKYRDKNKKDDPIDRIETITDDYKISYTNGNSFSLGDDHFTITAKTSTGYELSIPVSITVLKHTINPDITISDKVYDGTNIIDDGLITVSNINKDDYTIVSAFTDNPDSGNREATVIIRLTDEKFTNYSFEDQKQEREFKIPIKVLPFKLVKPTKEAGDYTYNGEQINFNILNYDSDRMTVSGNTGINAGTYTTIISLKNSNYIWTDGTDKDIELNYEIKKANLIYKDLSNDVTVKYDGNAHTANINIEHDSNTTLKYMDEYGNYTLDEIPTYINIGTYEIKYRLYKNDNYTDYIGNKSIVITGNTVTNNSSDYEGIYDGKNHSIHIDIKPNNYTIKYSINNTNYNLNELPVFKDVGEYTVNYKISADGYDDLIGSNKVKIYGISKINSTINVKDNILITKDNSFRRLSEGITTYSVSSEYKHYNKNNEAVVSDRLKTGDIIQIVLNGVNTYEYHIVYLGDTNGDGQINYLDYVNIYNHIQREKYHKLNKKLLIDEYLYAADMTQDEQVSYLDYIKVYNKIRELKGVDN